MLKAVFQIETLGCPGCGKKIEDHLLSQKGIKSVKNFGGLGKILIEFNEGETSTEEIKVLINDLGYQVEYIKVAETGYTNRLS